MVGNCNDVQIDRQRCQSILVLAEQRHLVKMTSCLEMPRLFVYLKALRMDFVILVLEVDREESRTLVKYLLKWAKQLDCEMGCWKKG
jgi:hypothetical protein